MTKLGYATKGIFQSRVEINKTSINGIGFGQVV